jgi:Ni,Fe-hydrogenase I cytochrome b subunit
MAKNPVSFGFMFMLLVLFCIVTGLAFYIYKQEYEAKIAELYHERDYEEGYEKLD